MSQDPVAEPKTERKGNRSRKANGKMSIEALCKWIESKGGVISFYGVRQALIDGGYDYSEGIDPMEAAPCVFAYYTGLKQKQELDLERDKARSAAAQADTDEIELARLQGLLVSKDEIRRIWENLVVTFREQIRGMSDLTLEQRKLVCDKLAALNLDAPAS